MEEGETSMEGAKREAWEEAGARIEVNELIGVYNVARLSQVHLIYRAKLINDIVNAGPESWEVHFFHGPKYHGTSSLFQVSTGLSTIIKKLRS